MTGRLRDLVAEPLSTAEFSAFGEVIEVPSGLEAAAYPINAGSATRYDGVATLDVEAGGGSLQVSVARAVPRELPVRVEALERHPLGSQAFVPLGGAPFLVIVAAGDEAPSSDSLRAFVARSGQGVNYRRGVWHFPLSALERESDFLVLDRRGPGENLEWGDLERAVVVSLAS